MTRHVFYSLHYDADRARTELIRGVPGLVPNQEAKPNDWAAAARTGELAVRRWFEQQVRGRSCTIVLIGAATKTRARVLYEIERSWALKLGVLGVHVHALKDAKGQQAAKGESPFPPELAPMIKVYDPPETDSKLAYRHIADHLARWVDEAVAARRLHP